MLHQKVKQHLTDLYASKEIESIYYLILEDIFGLNRIDTILNQSIGVTESQERKLSDVLDRLYTHEPIQYILGHTEFCGRKFSLDQSVLIPRPETEELVQLIIKENQTTSPKILDVGTGSGCIAVTLQLELDAMMVACDIAKKALTLAKCNATSLGAQIKFLQIDILQQRPEVTPLDVLVSNPPYVTENDKKQMQTNVLDHEPSLALFVSDQDPLIFYKRITDLGRELLKPGGKLYLEINERFGKEIATLLKDQGYSDIEVKQDLHDRDRFVKAIN